MSDNLKDWIKSIACAVVIAIAILQFIKPTIVSGSSMESTLHDRDYVLISRQSYKLFGGSPKLGDIIVFESDLLTDSGSQKLLIKRVIGVAGDTVSIYNGRVYLNGEMLVETYTKDGFTASDMDEITVPEGCVFVLGDNRQNSADSRVSSIGCVPTENILGKVFIRLFPLSSICLFE